MENMTDQNIRSEKLELQNKQHQQHQENTMNNLYQALSTFMQEADTAYQSNKYPELNNAFEHLNDLYERLSDEADQTPTPAPTPTKLIVITYQSYVEEVIPYSLKSLEFISDNLGCIDNIRILELREL
jgi:hypothetical protein